MSALPSSHPAATDTATDDRPENDPGHLLRERRRLAGEKPPSWVKPGTARRLATALRQSSRSWIAAAAVLATFLGFFGLLLSGMAFWLAATAAAVAVVLVQQGIIHTMGETNAKLADRLEGLEDRSWEIRESEELHRSVAEAFGDVLIQRDRDGAVIHANETYSTLFGEQHVVLPAPDIEAGTRDVLVETSQGERWFAWRDLLARDLQSGTMGIRSIARDITRRKNHEQELAEAAAAAQAASEAKSRFLATISHEIRTPLNGVMGVAQLLARTPLDATQRDHLSILKTSGDTLLALIEDLLDTARMEQGDLSIQTEPVELERLVEGVAAMMASRAADKGLPIATYVDPGLPSIVQADGGRLRQVLVNLLGNAVKFTSHGSVSLVAGRTTAGKLCFTVTDTGPGIAQVDRDRIFQPFVQTDDGSTRAHNGAGLGLAISRHIILRMGGEISVSVSDQGGSVFAVTIPLVALEDDCAVYDAPSLAPISSTQSIALDLPNGPASEAFQSMVLSLGYEIDANAELRISDAVQTDHDGSTIQIGHSGDGTEPRTDGRWLTWPVRRATFLRVLQANEAMANASAVPVENASAAQVYDLLLAEDDPVNAMIARSLLEGRGHHVTVVENGELAVAEAVTGRFDVVLLDRHMPVMDGFDALDTIRQFDPAQPVVILSADGQQESREDAAARGAMGYLIKPFDLEATDQLLTRLMTHAPEDA